MTENKILRAAREAARSASCQHTFVFIKDVPNGGKVFYCGDCVTRFTTFNGKEPNRNSEIEL